MTIGARREIETEPTLGPGEYSPEKGEKLTKVRTPHVDFRKNTGRLSIESENDIGPGKYKYEVEFGSGLKNMTIGRKTEEKIKEGPAPGHYNLNDEITKQRNPSYDFVSLTGRKERQTDDVPAPGQYTIPEVDKRKMTIGEKREDPKKDPVPAPGKYHPERADKQVKPNPR